MRIAVAKEIRSGEARVALVPDIISKLTKAGLEVVIEAGAGVASGFQDSEFTAAGATVKSGNVISDADVVASVTALTPDQMKSLKKGALTISFLSPTTSVDSIEAAASAGVTALSLELVPRISRAQSMDALTSQALCAGYRASLVAALLVSKLLQPQSDLAPLSVPTMFAHLQQMKLNQWVQNLLPSNLKHLKAPAAMPAK